MGSGFEEVGLMRATESIAIMVFRRKAMRIIGNKMSEIKRSKMKSEVKEAAIEALSDVSRLVSMLD